MKTNIRFITFILALCLVVTGCSLVSSDKKAGDSDQSIEKELKITETYTHKTPEDLDYDKCWILHGDQTSFMLSPLVQSGYNVTDAYVLLYAKDDTPVAYYNYYVADTEKTAAALSDALKQMGTSATQQGNVLYAVQNADEVQAAVLAMQSANIITDTKASSFAQMHYDSYGMSDYKSVK